MGGVSTSYILSLYPSSTMHIPLNDFLIENPPPTSGMTLGGNVYPHMGNPSYRVPSSGGNVYPHMGNPYHTRFSSHAARSMMIPLQLFCESVGRGILSYQEGPWCLKKTLLGPQFPKVSLSWEHGLRCHNQGFLSGHAKFSISVKINEQPHVS
jgi:hypothetical protein